MTCSLSITRRLMLVQPIVTNSLGLIRQIKPATLHVILPVPNIYFSTARPGTISSSRCCSFVSSFRVRPARGHFPPCRINNAPCSLSFATATLHTESLLMYGIGIGWFHRIVASSQLLLNNKIRLGQILEESSHRTAARGGRHIILIQAFPPLLRGLSYIYIHNHTHHEHEHEHGKK